MQTKLEMLKEYTIENEYLKVSFLNYGGSITGIYLKNSQPLENLVIAYKSKKDYFNDDFTFLNALVGPVAGRLEKATYFIDGKKHNITANDGVNNIHGGDSGISTSFFDVKTTANKATLTLNTNHKIDGFVGDFAYKVKYSLDADSLVIDFLCTPTELTTLNMTSHLYFNLSGDMQNSIENHILQIESFNKMKLQADNCPIGIVQIKKGDVFDFNKPKAISELLQSDNEEVQKANGFDVPYLLDGDIKLYDPTSKNSLTIETDADSVVVYTANYFNEDLSLNNGKKGYPYSSIALETLDMPNGINIVKDNTYVYGPNKPYKQKTIYTFKND